MTPKQKERRARILRVTLSHLRQYGYENVNMRDLAEAADVSPTTLYRLYDSKDILILATVRDQIDHLTSRVAEKEQPGLKRLIELLRTFGRSFSSEPIIGDVIPKLLFFAEPGSPATEVLLINAIRARRASVVDMQEVGDITPKANVEHLAQQLTTATWGPLLMCAKGLSTVDEVADELVKASLWALLPVFTDEGRKKALREIRQHPALSVLKPYLR